MARRSRFLEDLIGGVGLGANLADMYLEHQSGEAYTNAAKNAAVDSVPYVDATGDGVGAGSMVQTPATLAQQRTAGLQAQGDYWASRGDIKRASALYDQVDQMGLRGLQREDAQLGIDAKKRAAKDASRIEAARAEFEKTVKDPSGYIADLFNRDVIGSQDMAGKKVEYKPTKTGVMAWVVDENGTPIGQAKHYDMDTVKNQAFTHYLEQTDPKTAAIWQHQMRQDATQADRWERDYELRKTEGLRKEKADERRHQEVTQRLGILAGRGSEGNPLSKVKAARLQADAENEDAFDDALEKEDWATAARMADKLPTRAVKVKVANPDGTSGEDFREVNPFQLKLQHKMEVAAVRQGTQIAAGLKSAYPKAPVEKVGVNLETGEQVVISGGKEIPLTEFVAAQEKRHPTQRRGLAPSTADVGSGAPWMLGDPSAGQARFNWHKLGVGQRFDPDGLN